MEDFNFYREVSVKYPSKETIKKNIFANFDSFVGTKAQIAAEEERLNQLVKDEYRNEMQVYRMEQSKKEEQFKKDLFEEFDVTDNPKKDKAYSIAYEEGHSGGYSSIYNYFSTIVELIK